MVERSERRREKVLIRKKSDQELREESDRIFDKLDQEQRVTFKKNNGIFTEEDLAAYLYQFKQELNKVKKYEITEK